jgi:hypothetical protein
LVSVFFAALGGIFKRKFVGFQKMKLLNVSSWGTRIYMGDCLYWIHSILQQCKNIPTEIV